MADLIVFDLQRFALHDGPGIRTTVFLKGCPLDCVWCHNPESKKRAPQLGFLEKNCTSCGSCEEACPEGVHRITEEGKHEIRFSSCKACGKCTGSCIQKALKIIGKSMSTEEVMKTVLKDRDFYQKSGGGLTVSGGEPMLQFPALLSLLKAAKEEGLHVCLDTCGQAKEEQYAKIAPYVDLFLFDYKLTDREEHKTYTGVFPEQIRKNLDYLYTHGSRVFLRCPVIPGVNNNRGHYEGIAELSRRYDAIEQVNLMIYHDMAKGKAAQIGETYALSGLKTVEAQEKRKIYEEVKACGCLKLKES